MKYTNSGGDRMNNNDINVEISSLRQAANTILQNLEEIHKDLDKAKTAGNNALNALGGSGTPAGGAVNNKMITINTEEFEKTETSIKNFLESITNVSNTYQSAEDDFVSAINSYDPNGQ